MVANLNSKPPESFNREIKQKIISKQSLLVIDETRHEGNLIHGDDSSGVPSVDGAGSRWPLINKL